MIQGATTTVSRLEIPATTSKCLDRHSSLAEEDRRREDSLRTLQLKSSLTADQIAAIEIAISPYIAADELKTALRRENRRLDWARYRAHEQSYEEQLECDIVALKKMVQRLKMQTARHQRNQLIKAIATFYLSLQTTSIQQMSDVRSYQQMYGCSPALQALSDLEREEFDSMESLKLHWLWYRSQFKEFVLSIQSYKHLEAAEHVIIQATGVVRLTIDCHNQSKTIVCPVLQQFEFEDGEQLVRRITSEVNLVSVVGTTQEHLDPVGMLNRYHTLSDCFCK